MELNMPGPERNKLNPVPCRIPSFDRVRTIAPPREPTPPGAQASQCHEIAYALQRVSKVRRQFKQASQSLQESCANDAIEIEKLRRVQQVRTCSLFPPTKKAYSVLQPFRAVL